MSEKFQPLKGTRDFLPKEMIKRQFILDKIRGVFENFGFDPFETPALEKWEVLSAKGAGGPEILKETYNFEDRGKRRVGLRYDLTVPLTRVVSMNRDLPLPFKRYHITRVWRYGDVAKGRLREFWQADIDTVGSESMLADAEIIACTIEVFKTLGFKKFVVRLNNRKILSASMEYAGVDKKKVIDVLRIIDKLEKIGIDGVEKELSDKKISKNSIDKITEFIKIEGEPEKVLEKIKKMINDLSEGKEGVEELEQLVSFLKKMKTELKLKIDLSLARGLDYYTGPIFEVFVEEGAGSIAGGGRYDKMIGLFLGEDIPATGISLGIERIIEVMKDKKMLKTQKTKTKVFVVNVNEDVLDKTLEITQMLRKDGISANFDMRGKSLRRQLEYTDSLGIPYAVIIGPKEIEKDKVKIRDMKKRSEKEVKITDLTKILKNI